MIYRGLCPETNDACLSSCLPPADNNQGSTFCIKWVKRQQEEGRREREVTTSKTIGNGSGKTSS